MVCGVRGAQVAWALAGLIGWETAAAGAEIDLTGFWVTKSAGVVINPNLTLDVPFGLRIMALEHDLASGSVGARAHPVSKELVALGYQDLNYAFDGRLQGAVAVGTLTTEVKPVDNCTHSERRAAGIRVMDDGQSLELIYPAPNYAECKWTFDRFEDYAKGPYWVAIFRRLFRVREVRFVDGSSGERITEIMSGGSFRIEVAFELAPPAAVEVMLTTPADERRVVVEPTDRPDVFRSPVMVIRGGGEERPRP